MSELKRRGVLRVVLAYLAAGWLLLQIADLVFPAYGFSAEAMATLIAIVAIGIVPAAILAWVFEWTSAGLARDSGAVVPVERAKSMDRVIIVILTIAIAYFAIDKFILDPPPPVDSDKSIAVLPFINMSSDPEQDYFSDGISEELLNLLAGVKELRVISRSSSFAYRGDDIYVPDVSKALNVAYVLEGSVRKAGNRIRITAQLIEGRSDKHIWSETYDRTLQDVFAIQDEVSAQIIDQLRIELIGEAPHAYRTDPETYALFLRGKQQILKSGLMGDIEGARLMEEVVARDPDYVPALVRLSLIIWYERNNHDDSPYAGEFGENRIIELVERALEIDPDNANANTQMAWSVFFTTHDAAAAAELFEKALKKGLGDIDVLRMVAAFAFTIGDFEACIALSRRALARDPACVNCYNNHIDSLRHLGRLDEAEQIARQRVALAPGGFRGLGVVLLEKGDFDAADDAFAQISYDGERLFFQTRALYARGDIAEFETLLSKFIDEFGADMPWQVAILMAMSGDEEAAFEHLNMVFGESVDMFAFALRNPLFENLHGDPRWEHLKARAGLTDAQIAAANFTLPDGL